jgi:hypothetical protein
MHIFWSGDLKGRDRLRGLGVHDRITLKFDGRFWDWIRLAQIRDQWYVLVNTVMNFGFHKGQRIS